MEFSFLSMLTGAVGSVCVMASIIICICCKRDQASDDEKKAAENARRVIGGTGNRYQQVTMSFAINVLKLITTPIAIGARPPSCVFSPCALQASFSVCMLGANGSTQSEMVDTVFPHSGSITHAGDFLREMIQSIAQCRMDNSFLVFARVYANSLVRYSADFFGIVNEIFTISPFTTVDYGNASAIHTTTHQALAVETHGRLKEFLSTSWRPINRDQSSLIVVTAASFDGQWIQPFSRSLTRSNDFFVRAGESIKIDMMRQVNTFGYYANEIVQVLRMQYKKSGLAIYVVLPDALQGLEEFEKKLTPDGLLARCQAANQRKQLLEVSLPKFKMECEVGDSLVVALGNLGLKTSFNKDSADFSYMLDRKAEEGSRLWISGAVHKAVLEFAEEDPVGTSRLDQDEGGVSVSIPTTSSTTSRSLSTKSDAPKIPGFIADRPFLFVLVVESKMTPLLMGRFCGKR